MVKNINAYNMMNGVTITQKQFFPYKIYISRNTKF